MPTPPIFWDWTSTESAVPWHQHTEWSPSYGGSSISQPDWAQHDWTNQMNVLPGLVSPTFWRGSKEAHHPMREVGHVASSHPVV